MPDQPPLASPKQRKIAKMCFFASVLFLLPHFLGWSILRWFEVFPADDLIEIVQNSDGQEATRHYKLAAIFEVAVATVILSVVSLIFSGIAILREVLITVLRLKWNRGCGTFYHFGAVLLAMPPIFFAYSVFSVDQAFIGKAGGLWGAVAPSYLLAVSAVFLSALNLFDPALIRRSTEYHSERRSRNTPKP